MNTQNIQSNKLTKQEESRAAVELLVSDVDFESIAKRTCERDRLRRIRPSDMKKVYNFRR
ncbi:hypothetical protein A9Q91_03010 [Candidatus Gracilibacteria bacterium 28_42_T64]|nr:hypothetical protein A9Q91_03010 [Candidatus Gracilibacteria bacterium 28_42_T64]